ncbi:MAG: hypothetical protein DSY81_09695 [Bacillota bacterium]|nr:MAG: hypothetical protein DSY81_09695 [Bacillota bacterium]
MPRIVAEKGPDRGSTWSIREQGVLLIGRDSSAQIALRDEEISRRHCQIEFRDRQWLLRDLESTNGVLLNGELITEPTALKHNDHIEVGITRLTFLSDDDPLLGSEIGGCRIEQRIGRGGMGTVYRARQQSLDRPIALKILSEKYTSDPQFIEMFIREARAAGRLSHPHIVQVYDVGKEGAQHYFTMELVAGGSVEKVIDEGGAISVDQAMRIARDAATGLEYAEKQGVVHRDIKPGNLMIATNGAVKIGDLGIARTTDESGVASQQDGVSGSPHYIAPEQARGEAIDQRADIYSLGATLFHCLAGRTPYRGAGAREVILKHIQSKSAPDLSEMAPEVPAEVCELVARMMSPDPSGRPANARVLGEELDQLLIRHGSRSQQQLRSSRLSSWKTWLLLLILMGGTIGGLLQLQKSRLNEDLAMQTAATRRLEISRRLDLADSAVSRGEPVSAQEILDSLEDVPEDLLTRIRDLEQAIELEHRRIDTVSREELARSRLAEILTTGDDKLPPERRLEQLNSLARNHPDTRAGTRSAELARSLKVELERQEKLEDDALIAWKQTLARAQGWRTSGNPARAREEALTLSEQFASTDAWNLRIQFLEQLDFEATRLWAQARADVLTLLAEDRIAQADDVIDGVVSRALLPCTRDLEPLLRAEVKQARETAAAIRTPEVGPVVQEGWSAFNRTFSGREACVVMRDAALRDGLPESSMVQIDRHLAFLGSFDQLLLKIPAIELPRKRDRIIEGSRSGDISAPHVTIEKDRVSYRESPQQVGRYLLWKEIAPGSRLDLLLEAGPPQGILEHLTVLLEWAGRKSDAMPLWSRIDPKTTDLVRQLVEETQD